MKKILVPTDFSPEASYAFEVAQEIADQGNNAEILLLHIIETPAGASFNSMGDYTPRNEEEFYVLKLIEKAKRDLEEVVSSSSKKNITITSKVSLGNPYKGIADAISHSKADLIVMGSKGTSGISEWLVGSNTQKVVRFAGCPVITVKKKIQDLTIRNIVFSSDFKEEIKGFDQLQKFADKFFAKIHLLYVNTPKSFESSDEVLARMKKFAGAREGESFTFNIFNAHSVEEGINKFSQEIKADVISMATHGRKGFEHLFGSITESVVNHADSLLFTFQIK